MRDDDEAAFVVADVVLQPAYGFEIEVVGGLVEQQDAGFAEERLCQQHTHFLAALQLRHLALVQGFGDVEAVEQYGGIALGGVAAFLADNTFEFAEAHAVLVGQIVMIFGVEFLACLERRPQRGVAHNDCVDHAISVEGELILAQDAHLLGAGDGAFGGIDFPGHDAHEGGFSGTIGAGDGVAAAGKKRDGHVFKENLGAEAHRDVIEGQQG